MKIHSIEKNLFVLPEMLRLVAKKKLIGDCMNNLFSQNNFVCAVKLALPESVLQYLSFDQKQFHLWNTDQLNVNNLYSTEKQSTKYFFPLITPGGWVHRLIREGRITFYMWDNEQQHLHGNIVWQLFLTFWRNTQKGFT